MTMPDRDHLHRLLQAALEVEMFTIPPYLTALYSIIEGSNAAAVQVIHSVVMEEMLHAALVSNLINAVGASPRLIAVAGGAGPQRIGYPAQAPHISRPLIVELAPFSKAAVQGFMAIERPESPTDGAGSEDGAGDENEGGDDRIAVCPHPQHVDCAS